MGIVEAFTGAALGVNVGTFNSLQLAEYNKSGEGSSFAGMARGLHSKQAGSLYLGELSTIVAFHPDPSNYSHN